MSLHIARDRIVLTWEPDGKPEAVLTGYINDRVFYLEHVIAFPNAKPTSTLNLLFAATQVAPEHDINAIALHLVPGHPYASGLKALAERFKFKVYHRSEEADHYVLYLGGK